jgi:REP element-mobilizing transposase RayT
MGLSENLIHASYECKHHVVFYPKYGCRILKDEFAEYGRQPINLSVRGKEHIGILEMNRK